MRPSAISAGAWAKGESGGAVDDGESGRHPTLALDAGQLSSGLYLVRLQADRETLVRTVTVVR